MNLKPLEKEIIQARLSLAEAIRVEEKSGYDFDDTMERKYAEGWAEALDYIYIILNGAPFAEDN